MYVVWSRTRSGQPLAKRLLGKSFFPLWYCVSPGLPFLEDSKSEVLKAAQGINPRETSHKWDKLLFKATGLGLKIYNIAPFTLEQVKNQDPSQLFENLVDYINGFPPFLQDVFNARLTFQPNSKRWLIKTSFTRSLKRFYGPPGQDQRLEMYCMGT